MGLKDEEIIVLLRRQRNPTFFTRDAGFYELPSDIEGIAWLWQVLDKNEVAAFIRRFLRHPDFATQAKRLGRVVRISRVGMAMWRVRSQSEMHTSWKRAE